MRISTKTGVLCGFLLICLSFAYGQGARGTVNGSVADPSGALVSGAQVTIKDTLTGQITQVATTSDGNYSAPFLPPGKYQVTASHDGFETETQTDVTLTADQVASVNFVLKVGSTSTKIEVTASSPQVDTTTGAVSQVIGEKAIAELPLDGRNPAELVFVAPGSINGAFTNGIALPGSGSGFPQETAASVNGSRMGGVSYQLDGIIHMNNYFQTASPFPNPDATQEFRVITNNFDAQYGYASGGIVSIATRSGTNQWHGNVFEFIRNNVLNAEEYFSKVADPLKRNQFGGSLGGPIIKDKLFIFGNLQITKERISISTGSAVVPNNAELAGDFSGLCTSGFNGAGVCQDKDPNTGATIDQLYTDQTHTTIFPRNQIPTSLFAPFSVNLENGIPKTDDPNGLINLTGRSQINDGYEYTLRTDYNLSHNQTLSGHVFYDNFDRPPFSGNGDYLISDRSNQAQALNISGNYTWVVRPNLVNDLRVGFSRNNSQTIQGITQPDGSPISPSLLGANLPSVSKTIGDVSTNGFGISQIPVVQARHNWIVDDTLSLNTGKHSITVGLNVFSQYSLEDATWEADPLMFFNGSVTGNDRADFLLGDLQQIDVAAGEFNEYHSLSWAAFGQDSIKLKPNLTINLGLRWEPQIAPLSLQNKLADYFPGQQSTVFPNAPVGMVYPGDAGVPKGGWANTWDTFLPRISVAWSPKALPGTVFRSAFGLMVPPYDFSFYNYQGHIAPFSPTFVLNYNDPNLTCPLNVQDPFACYTPTGDKDPFPPFAGPGFIPQKNTTFTLPTTMIASFAKGYVPAQEQTWNLSIEHSFGNDLVLGVVYIGRHDIHLPIPLELNPGIYSTNPLVSGLRANPNFDNLDEYDSAGVASYNGLQFTADKRFAHGLQFTSNFTWSKQLDMSSMASLSNVGSIYDPFDPRAAYGLSDLNIPRIWNNTFVYQTPKLASLGKLGSGVLGNWEISGIWVLHSGQPFTILGGDGNNNSASQVGGDHADVVPGQSFDVHQGSKSQWLQQYFNPGAFTFNAAGTFGNTARNLLQGPGWNNADILFAKNFQFRERYNVQFRWEMFNAFNRTEFGVPDNNVGDGTFGQVTYTTGTPRLMQAGLKLNF